MKNEAMKNEEFKILPFILHFLISSFLYVEYRGIEPLTFRLPV